MKDKLGGKITAEFVALKPKTYAYLKIKTNKKMLKKNNNRDLSVIVIKVAY